MPAQLIALMTAISYAVCLISARRALQYSTPMTAALASAIVQNVTLWSIVFLTGGIPEVSPVAVILFIIVGILQLGTRLFAYTGVAKIGASRSSTLQATSPLISTVIAITILQEEAGFAVLMGTLLVVTGVILISWRPEKQILNYRWWHILLPLTAALFTGVNHPIRRFALQISNQPVFLAALMGITSLTCIGGYLTLPSATQRPDWNRRALIPLLSTGIFETLGIITVIYALSVGPVVVVAPVAATYPLWVLLGTVVFSRDLEQINVRIFISALCIMAGTVAIYTAN
jgi:drug/metabolite transporter (DMT)-like permease